MIVTGDHSTPAKLRSHSWHPVPTLLWSPTAMPDQVQSFGERACASGHLGIFHATNMIPQAMAHAGGWAASAVGTSSYAASERGNDGTKKGPGAYSPGAFLWGVLAG